MRVTSISCKTLCTNVHKDITDSPVYSVFIVSTGRLHFHTQQGGTFRLKKCRNTQITENTQSRKETYSCFWFSFPLELNIMCAKINWRPRGNSNRWNTSSPNQRSEIQKETQVSVIGFDPGWTPAMGGRVVEIVSGVPSIPDLAEHNADVNPASM